MYNDNHTLPFDALFPLDDFSLDHLKFRTHDHPRLLPCSYISLGENWIVPCTKKVFLGFLGEQDDIETGPPDWEKEDFLHQAAMASELKTKTDISLYDPDYAVQGTKGWGAIWSCLFDWDKPMWHDDLFFVMEDENQETEYYFSSLSRMRHYLEVAFSTGSPMDFGGIEISHQRKRGLLQQKRLFNPVITYQPAASEPIYLILKRGWYRQAFERAPGQKPSCSLGAPKLGRTIASSIGMLTRGASSHKAVA